MKRLLNLAISWLLFLLAYNVALVLCPVGILYAFVRRVFVESLSELFYDLAYIYDVVINVVWGDFLNDVFRKRKRGYQYGDPNDSISRVLGKNKELFTLSKFEAWVAKQLNRIDPNHVEKAAK